MAVRCELDTAGTELLSLAEDKLAGAVYVLHAFQKKAKKGVKTPKGEMELIRKRLRAAEEHHAEWHAAPEREEGGETGGRGRGQ
jgi:hypothetical protein